MNSLSRFTLDRPRTGYLYFLVMRDPRDACRDFGVVKIGITTRDVMDRVAALQTGNPYDLVLFDSISTNWPRAVEHFMHRTHATDMVKPEWIRCARDELPRLVSEASIAAERIAARKRKEETYAGRVSSGLTRRASIGEYHVHREARRLMKELVPARLDLRTAELRLNAASGVSGGIPGVVRVKLVPPLQRFDPALAEATFPELTRQCAVPRVQGAFRWRGVPQPTQYADRYETFRAAERAALSVAEEFVKHGARIDENTMRTPEVEALHDQFLKSLRRVYTLEGDLAELRTELIVALEDYDALEPVCSYVRRLSFRVDTAGFRRAFPNEFSECCVTVPAQLRKYVYPTRSY
jgi:hypothetical protein